LFHAAESKTVKRSVGEKISRKTARFEKLIKVVETEAKLLALNKKLP
jgi:hypothetical protein